MAIPKKDLDELLHANVITPQTVWDIEQYYLTKKQHQSNPLLAIFAALGGILVGLGIILIFAHNWDNFPRQVKTALAFTPLLLSQAFAAYCIIKNKSIAFKETAAVLVFFSVGASISLVAQIYNISGDFPKFLLTWSLLCAPLMYLLRSSAAVLLHLIFITWYAVQKGYFGSPPETPFFYVILLAVVIPVYLKQLKEQPNGFFTRAMHFLIPISAFICFGTFISGIGVKVYITLYMAFLCLLYNIGSLPYFEKNSPVNGYKIVGLFLGIIQLIGATFSISWMAFYETPPQTDALIFLAVLLALSAGIIYKYTLRNEDYYKWVTFIFPVLYGFSLLSPGFAATVANIIVFAVGINYVITGIARLNYAVVNFGLIIITILAGCRFFDTDLSFVIRGLLFVGVGVGFFVANYTVSKRKQQNP